MTGVCGTEVLVDAAGAVFYRGSETIALQGKPCTKCYDLLVEELIEDESLEDALARGYVPVILED